MWPWISQLSFLGFYLFICKMRWLDWMISWVYSRYKISMNLWLSQKFQVLLGFFDYKYHRQTQCNVRLHSLEKKDVFKGCKKSSSLRRTLRKHFGNTSNHSLLGNVSIRVVSTQCFSPNFHPPTIPLIIQTPKYNIGIGLVRPAFSSGWGWQRTLFAFPPGQYTMEEWFPKGRKGNEQAETTDILYTSQWYHQNWL